MSKSSEEIKLINNLSNFWEFAGYIFRYRMKEFLILVIIILMGIILSLCISFDKKHGFKWRPAADVKIQTESK